MKKIKGLIFALLLPLIALAACATHYHKEGVFHNGYSDYKIAEDRFVVTFRANEFTPQEKVLEYALKRAAVLTLKQGFRYFVVLEQADSAKDLHYPSLRLVIQCYAEPPLEKESIDAPVFLAQH